VEGKRVHKAIKALTEKEEDLRKQKNTAKVEVVAAVMGSLVFK
jgi:hypothetical protein